MFHNEYLPQLNTTKHQAIYEGVYELNQPIDPGQLKQSVIEFLRKRGNLENEPVVKPRADVIKIFGDPKLPTNGVSKSTRHSFNGLPV